MWEAKEFAGNTFTRRAMFTDRVDAWEQADIWASEGGEVWLTFDGRLDRIFKG